MIGSKQHTWKPNINQQIMCLACILYFLPVSGSFSHNCTVNKLKFLRPRLGPYVWYTQGTTQHWALGVVSWVLGFELRLGGWVKILDVESCWTFGFEPWMLSCGCWIVGVGCWAVGGEFWVVPWLLSWSLGVEPWMLGLACWVVGVGCWVEPWMLGLGC